MPPDFSTQLNEIRREYRDMLANVNERHSDNVERLARIETDVENISDDIKEMIKLAAEQVKRTNKLQSIAYALVIAVGIVEALHKLGIIK